MNKLNSRKILASSGASDEFITPFSAVNVSKDTPPSDKRISKSPLDAPERSEVLRKPSIGILSGSFDPVHAGHIALALAAKEAAGLDAVYFAPEVRPRRKAGVTHIAHRIAMLELAVKPHHGLHVLELNDKNFTPAKILPKLHARFPDDQLYFICGEDMLAHMPTWPLVQRLLADMTLVIGQRHKTVDIQQALQLLNPPQRPIIFELDYSHIASSDIRQALATHQKPNGLLKTTEGYIKKHWLYAALFSDSTKS